ncbi:MAG: penicillin-binding protein, partial [Oscillospiraceae bacterium]|nr:penicillin-binding protein [Oscillospiraceae bacterium]
PALVILAFVFCAMIYGTGARTFLQGFLYTLILWTVVKLFVTLVLNCCWYAHTTSAWIKGTEDMKSEYQNYKFYLSSIPRSITAGAVVSVLVGLVIMIVGG